MAQASKAKSSSKSKSYGHLRNTAAAYPGSCGCKSGQRWSLSISLLHASRIIFLLHLFILPHTPSLVLKLVIPPSPSWLTQKVIGFLYTQLLEKAEVLQHPFTPSFKATNNMANTTSVAAAEGLLKVSHQRDEIHILSLSIYLRV